MNIELTVSLGSQSWPVRIEHQPDGTYRVYGRLTMVTLLVHKATDGYLVAIPSHQRSGVVPADCNRYDIETYCGIKNVVDALTVSAAANLIIAYEQGKERKSK